MNLAHLTTGASLSEARAAVHQAAQATAALAWSHSEGKHDSLEWNSYQRALVGGGCGPWQAALRIEDLTWMLLALGNIHEELPAEGHTVLDALQWMREVTLKGLGDRTLELPEPAVHVHPAASGRAFELPPGEQLQQLTSWFDAGYWVIRHVLEGLGESVAFQGPASSLAIITPAAEGRVLVGMCAGTERVDEPHFFVRVMGEDAGLEPVLPHGRWTKGEWTGAWLSASDLVGTNPERVLPAFLQAAITAAG